MPPERVSKRNTPTMPGPPGRKINLTGLFTYFPPIGPIRTTRRHGGQKTPAAFEAPTAPADTEPVTQRPRRAVPRLRQPEKERTEAPPEPKPEPEPQRLRRGRPRLKDKAHAGTEDVRVATPPPVNAVEDFAAAPNREIQGETSPGYWGEHNSESHSEVFHGAYDAEESNGGVMDPEFQDSGHMMGGVYANVEPHEHAHETTPPGFDLTPVPAPSSGDLIAPSSNNIPPANSNVDALVRRFPKETRFDIPYSNPSALTPELRFILGLERARVREVTRCIIGGIHSWISVSLEGAEFQEMIIEHPVHIHAFGLGKEDFSGEVKPKLYIEDPGVLRATDRFCLVTEQARSTEDVRVGVLRDVA